MNFIKSKVLETRDIEWRKAKWFQNENLKKIDEVGLERLKKSLQTNFFIMPFHVWKEGDVIWILDGHHRQIALNELISEGIEVPDLLPATFIQCKDRQEAAKYVLIYSSIYAKIQSDGLDDFMKEFDIQLEDFKFEIDLPEFSLPRFEQKFTPIEFENEIDDFKPNEEIPIVVKPGDIFQLNNHKFGCLDAFDKESWERLSGNKKAHIIFTDPPYNLPANYIGNLGKTNHKNFVQASGELGEEEFKNWLEAMMKTMITISRDGSIHFICMDFRHIWHMTEAGRNAYGVYGPKQLCVWNKSQGSLGDFYRAKHELVFIYKSGTAKHFSKLSLKDRIRYNVWDYLHANSLANPDRDQLTNHPTPKPVEMVKDAIEDVSEEGHLVADLFLGSGTTLIAADLTKRTCIGTEIEPKYCQNIIIRYLQYCEKQGKSCTFQHLNGKLTVDDFQWQNPQKRK